MVTLPLTLLVETFIGLRVVLPFKGTFPIGNLILGLRLGFFKDTLFQKLWSHFLGFYFLFYFPFKNKNKISGDSNLFPKIIFSQIKSESRRSSGGAREKCGSTQRRGQSESLPRKKGYKHAGSNRCRSTRNTGKKGA